MRLTKALATRPAAVALHLFARRRTMSDRSSRLPGFHKLATGERVATLCKHGFLSQEGLEALNGPGLTLGDADHMIENVVSTFGVPMGVALNMVVNGKE